MGVVDNELNWRGVRPLTGIRGIWPAPNSTRVYASELLSGAGSLTVYTVPAGKILFVSTAVLVTRYGGTSDVSATLRVRDDVDSDIYRIVAHYYSDPAFQTAPLGFSPALEAAAAWDVYVKNVGSGVEARGFIFGWLEDA